MQKSKFLLIDSRDRVTGVSHNFSVQFKPGFQPIKSVKLLSVAIPLTNYTINSSNQNIFFNDGVDRTAVIAPGVYDYNSILGAIKTAMEATGYTGTITVTYSATSFEYTISGTVAFSLTFGTHTLNSAAYILGFSPTDTSSATSHTGNSVSTLSIPPYFFINLDCLPKSVATSNSEYGSFVIYTNTVSGFDNFFWDKSQYSLKVPGPPTGNAVQFINVSLESRGNLPFDLNGTDWSMLLELDYS